MRPKLKCEQQACGSPLQLQQLYKAQQHPSNKLCVGGRRVDAAAAVLSESAML